MKSPIPQVSNIDNMYPGILPYRPTGSQHEFPKGPGDQTPFEGALSRDGVGPCPIHV